MNKSIKCLSLLSVFVAAVVHAQTPAAGTITAIPATQRIGADGLIGSASPQTAALGIYDGMCAKWAKQALNTSDGLVNTTAQASLLVDGLGSVPVEPLAGNQTPTSQRGRFFDRAPQIDYQNNTGDGLHSPSFYMPWDQTECRLQGTQPIAAPAGAVTSLGPKFAVRMRGNLHIPTAGVHTFVMRSDDGYSLTVGGQNVATYNANRGPAVDSRRASFAQPGVYPIEVVYWDQGGIAALEIFIAEGAFCFASNNVGAAVSSCAVSGADLSNAGDAAATASFSSTFKILDYRRLNLPTWVTASSDPAFTDADERCTVVKASDTCGPLSTNACGNGIRERVNTGTLNFPGPFIEEACDDGNTANGDGCSSTCTLEAGASCGTGPLSVCGPKITTPIDGSSTNDTTPTIGGSCKVAPAPQNLVTIRDASNMVLCTATCMSNGSFSCDSVALPEGTYSISATQLDLNGNPSPAGTPVTFRVDTTPPDTTIATGPAEGATVGTSTNTFTFTSNESPVTFECSLDGGMFVSCPATYTTGSLGEGSHTLSVRAIECRRLASDAHVDYRHDTASCSCNCLASRRQHHQ
jgi:cysteine-rich repeat protein